MKINYWKDSFAREVEGLEYKYPLSIGDVVYYKFEDDEKNERSKRFPMKVIEVGVPTSTSHTYETRRTPMGRNGEFRMEGNDYEEGVRVQHIWYEGDKGRGMKENFGVTKLEKFKEGEWSSQRDRWEEFRKKQVEG